ncbi:hypothetical protein AB0D59_49140 [Streptomyces sp. NPDC048417]
MLLGLHRIEGGRAGLALAQRLPVASGRMLRRVACGATVGERLQQLGV